MKYGIVWIIILCTALQAQEQNEQLKAVALNVAEVCCACKQDTSAVQEEIDLNSTMIDMLKTSTGQLQSEIDELDMASTITLPMLTGFVDTTNPPTILQGTGFTVAGVGNGVTNILFNTPFATAPYVVAVVNTNSNGSPAAVDAVTTTGFTLRTYRNTSAPHLPGAQQAFFWVIE